jgi:hypothetical protein
VPKRRRLKPWFYNFVWRSDVAFRLGLPALGVIVAVGFALLITRL